MARIRSVHPSLFTDEAWVSCSPLARLLYVGLWTDADDQGLFEWKPLQIKMRLLAGDGADVPTLLAELASADLLASFDHAGKKYGAIKSFRKYQRPKKPNAVHPLPAKWRAYVSIDAPSTEPDPDDEPQVPHQTPTDGEKSPQMEEEGEDVGEGKDANASPVVGKPSDDVRTAFDEWNELAERAGLPKALTLDKARRATIKGRLATGGLEAWRTALAAVERSSHCRGENERAWRADLDFVCQLKSWKRLHEGFYGVGATETGGSQPVPLRTFPGPVDLRAALTKAMGEPWVRSYLDTATYDDANGAITPSGSIAAGKLKAALPVLTEHGAHLAEPKSRTAA
jgi:hypothetical protein